MSKKQILQLIAILLAILLLGFLSFSLIVAMRSNDRLAMPFGFGMAIVLSGSMEPELSVDDLVLIKRARELEVGQIVVYQTETDSLTVHRIIKISGDTIITQGDANNIPDDPITKDMIQGEVFLTIPFVGAVVGFLRKPVVMLLMLAAALGLYIASDLSERRQVKKNESQK